jgi:hypothetical protein
VGEVLDPNGGHKIEWDSSQLFLFDGHGMSHLGRVVPIKNVQISLVGKLPYSTCTEEELPSGQNCEEVILIGDNIPNSGHFFFNFSDNSDGLGNPVVPWAHRYQHLRVRISASDHTLTTHTSDEVFSFAGSLDDSAARKCLKKSPAIEASVIRFHTQNAAAHDERLVNRRLETTTTLTSSYSMGFEANFKSIKLILLGDTEDSYTLWKDSNTASPDLTFELFPDTYIGSLVLFTTEEYSTNTPSAFPTHKPSAFPTITRPTSSPDISNDDDDDDDDGK